MLRLEAKVGTKGQAVIPKPIRDQMGIRPGDKVYFRVEKGMIIVEKPDGDRMLEEFLGAYEKRALDGPIDWDARSADQARDRFDRARREG